MHTCIYGLLILIHLKTWDRLGRRLCSHEEITLRHLLAVCHSSLNQNVAIDLTIVDGSDL